MQQRPYLGGGQAVDRQQRREQGKAVPASQLRWTSKPAAGALSLLSSKYQKQLVSFMKPAGHSKVYYLLVVYMHWEHSKTHEVGKTPIVLFKQAHDELV